MHEQGEEQYLHFLKMQTGNLLKRASYLRNALLGLVLSLSSLVLCILTMSFIHVFVQLGMVIAVFFVLGMLLLLYALYFAFRELRISLSPMQMESALLQKLIKSELSQKSKL